MPSKTDCQFVSSRQCNASLYGCEIGWQGSPSSVLWLQVYFWDEETDEVAWEPPAGSQPRTEGENEAVFAAAHAPSSATTAGPESKSAPADDEKAGPSAVELPSGMDSVTAETGRERTETEREDGELETRPADILMPDETIEKVHSASCMFSKYPLCAVAQPLYLGSWDLGHQAL